MDNRSILNITKTWLFKLMSTESLNRTSHIIETPNKVVDVDVLKQRLFIEKKKENLKRTVIFSAVFVSIGVLALITY